MTDAKSTMGYVIGVDPSLTNTGIALLSAETGGLIKVGNTKEALSGWRRQSKAFRKTPKGQAWRLLSIVEYLGDMLAGSSGKPQKLWAGYEDYSFDSVNMSFSLGELGGVLKSRLAPACEDMVLASPKSLKSFAVQDGMAEKKPIIKKAREEAGGVIGEKPSSDVCDAYFLAKYAWYRFFPEQVVLAEKHRDLLRHRLGVAQAR